MRYAIPEFVELEVDGGRAVLDPEEPNWILTSEEGVKILRLARGKSLDEVVRAYAESTGLDLHQAWVHCHTFLRDVERAGFLAKERRPYPGRAEVLELGKLRQVWLHLTNRCNLSCSHCLVESGPSGPEGRSTAFWKEIVREARDLGATEFCVTGGEPFVREDFIELLEEISDLSPKKVLVLTNGTLLGEREVSKLSEWGVELQVSLEGPRKVNDSIRGRGSFEKAVRGIKKAIDAGLKPVLATTLLAENLSSLPELPEIAASLDIEYIHLFPMHPRGRASGLRSPGSEDLLRAVRLLVVRARELGVGGQPRGLEAPVAR
jgi:sulfatase maturation enzyme AslB (radical SAM superfamily)